MRKACNATAIENLVEKAKSLLAEAKNETSSGNHTEAAKLVVEAKHVINEARSMGTMCLKGKLMKRHMDIAEKRIEKAEELREKIAEKREKIKEKAEEKREKVAEKTAREFNITASSFSFSPNAISVSKGDKIKIRIANAGGTHTFDIDELNIHKSTPAGVTEIEFTASKSGTFKFYCAMPGHKDSGMKGSLEIA